MHLKSTEMFTYGCLCRAISSHQAPSTITINIQSIFSHFSVHNAQQLMLAYLYIGRRRALLVAPARRVCSAGTRRTI